MKLQEDMLPPGEPESFDTGPAKVFFALSAILVLIIMCGALSGNLSISLGTFALGAGVGGIVWIALFIRVAVGVIKYESEEVE